MTPYQLLEYLARLGWDWARLAHRLGITPSPLADLERGCSRGKHSRPAPIPEVVEPACRSLGEHESDGRLLTPAERAALWRNDGLWPRLDHVIDDSRDGIYSY